MSLLIFYLIDPSNINNVVSKSPAIIVRESMSLYNSLKTCLMYLSGCLYIGCIYIYDHWLLLLHWSFYHYVMSFFVSFSLCFYCSLFCQRWKLQLLVLFVCLFCFSLHLLGKSSSVRLFWAFVYPCLWDGFFGYSIPMGFDFLFNLLVCVFDWGI